VSDLAERFAAVESRIAAACARAGRARTEVTLVAVSKLHPAEVVVAAHALGQRDFGENYAQELRDKHQSLAACAGLRWHAIGPVQPKNVRYLARAAHTFHALDRLEVAQELSRRRTGTPLRCLVQVNLAGEATKHGLPAAELAGFLAQVRSLPNLALVGLTTLPPLMDDPEASRPHFRELKALAGALGLVELSMGTTSDFELAVEEGATLVRVGTALFGERPAPAESPRTPSA
jgi:pyridoxal phosphate enzyme (YggS family)